MTTVVKKIKRASAPVSATDNSSSSETPKVVETPKAPDVTETPKVLDAPQETVPQPVTVESLLLAQAGNLANLEKLVKEIRAEHRKLEKLAVPAAKKAAAVKK